MALEQPNPPLVGLIMGSLSDWEIMRHTATRLRDFKVPFEKEIVSAHRTPVWMAEYATGAADRGVRVIIAAAGGSAHLPGMVAAHTHLPVIGCPMPGWSVNGLDSLLSIVNMPAGIPVNTMAIGKAGAINAALSAIAILALGDPQLSERLRRFRDGQRDQVRQTQLPEE